MSYNLRRRHARKHLGFQTIFGEEEAVKKLGHTELNGEGRSKRNVRKADRKKKVKPFERPILKNFFVRSPTGRIWTNPIMAENVQEVRKEARRICSFRYTSAVDGNYKILDGNTEEAKILDRFMFKRSIHSK